MQSTVCDTNKCAGCMACIDICPKNAIKITDSISDYNACIDQEKCVECGNCHKICPQNNEVKLHKPIICKQGWAKDNRVRAKSSSGGIASALALDFLKNGGVVYACCLDDGKFVFKMISDEQEWEQCIGSKYVKSNPEGVYKSIRNQIKKTKVLFIGLPCQVAAAKRFVGENNESNLYTIDLICHGSPSPKLLDYFFAENHLSLQEINHVSFRKKQKFSIRYGKDSQFKNDYYTYAFLKGLDYTENCYSCKYATIKRVADITLGDAWGSSLSAKEKEKGISLILCSTEKGLKLLNQAPLELEEFKLDIAMESNEQLVRPSYMPKQRARFIKSVKKNEKFGMSLFRSYPLFFIKSKVRLLVGLFK